MVFRVHLLFAYTALCLLSLYHTNAIDAASWPKQKVKVTSFSWNDCGPATYPDHVLSLAVTPDPVKIPGNLSISTSFNVTVPSPTDVSLALVIEKKIAGFWVKIPCVAKIGSCTYDDICTTWAAECPTYFAKYGLPCTCPFPVKFYSVSDVLVDATEKLPPGTAGDLRINATLVSAASGPFVCLQLLVTVATN